MAEWDDDAEVLPCPACGAEVYEEAERCPECDEYIVPGSGRNVFLGRPLWWVILGLLGTIALIVFLMGS